MPRFDNIRLKRDLSHGCGNKDLCTDNCPFAQMFPLSTKLCFGYQRQSHRNHSQAGICEARSTGFDLSVLFFSFSPLLVLLYDMT